MTRTAARSATGSRTGIPMMSAGPHARSGIAGQPQRRVTKPRDRARVGGALASEGSYYDRLLSVDRDQGARENSWVCGITTQEFCGVLPDQIVARSVTSRGACSP